MKTKVNKVSLLVNAGYAKIQLTADHQFCTGGYGESDGKDHVYVCGEAIILSFSPDKGRIGRGVSLLCGTEVAFTAAKSHNGTKVWIHGVKGLDNLNGYRDHLFVRTRAFVFDTLLTSIGH